MKHLVISTNFYSDDYVLTLTASQKLIYNFFFINPLLSFFGIMPHIRHGISKKLAITEKSITTAIQKFIYDGKIVEEDHWLFLVDFFKLTNYQTINKRTREAFMSKECELPPKFFKRIKKELEKHTGNLDNTGEPEGTPS